MLLCIGKTLLNSVYLRQNPRSLAAPEVLSYTGGTRLVPLYQKDSFNRRIVPEKDLCALTSVMPRSMVARTYYDFYLRGQLGSKDW
jgi:hypothetical protein